MNNVYKHLEKVRPTNLNLISILISRNSFFELNEVNGKSFV